MTENFKKHIDEMSYETMLGLWRFSPAGGLYFQGETGDYFSKVMEEKRSQLAEGEAAAISKRIGWDR